MADQELKQEQEQEQKEYTPVEQRAMEMGWKPLEEFDGDPVDFRSAETFVALAPLYEKISHSSKENKRLREAMQHMAGTFDKVREQSYQQALKTLRDERKTAFQDGDIDRVTLIEDQIENVKEQARIVKETATLPNEQAGEFSPAFQDFVDRNTWYKKDRGMTGWSDARGVELYEQGMSPDQILKQIEKEVKLEFPHKFTNPNRTRTSAVEGGENTKTSNTKQSIQLNSHERRIMETIVKSGAMTEAEYMAELKKIR